LPYIVFGVQIVLKFDDRVVQKSLQTDAIKEEINQKFDILKSLVHNLVVILG